MAHDNYVMLISLDLDGRLDEREQNDLRQHLRGCAHCARAWDRMHQMDAMFKVQPELAPRANFSVRVMAGVRRIETQRRWKPWIVTLLVGMALGVVTSVAVPILVVRLELYHPLLEIPLVAMIASWIGHGIAGALSWARLGLHDLLRWLAYLMTDPVALGVVISGLVIAGTWIGLLEVLKTTPAVDMAQQQA